MSLAHASAAAGREDVATDDRAACRGDGMDRGRHRVRQHERAEDREDHPAGDEGHVARREKQPARRSFRRSLAALLPRTCHGQRLRSQRHLHAVAGQVEDRRLLKRLIP